jgi:hypothetical protein
MARTNDPKDTVSVRNVPSRKGVTVGKPTKIVTAAQRSKMAYPMTGGTSMGAGGNFYSPELSTDFLELPQSADEQRSFYRFFYDHDPFVGQAIDLTDELPLSKIRLRMPEAKNRELAERSLRFCTRWAKDRKLLQRLLEISHEYNLLGEAFIFVEDTSPEEPDDLRVEIRREVTAEGDIVEETVDREDADERAEKWLKKNYKGWTAIRVLPPEQVHMESFPFTDEKLIELIPDSKTKAIINKANQGDPQALRIVNSMPPDVVNAIAAGENIPLNTDPEAGSFVVYLSRKKSQYEPRGKSVLQRCLRWLIFADKVRQSLTSIASRHMTPYRVIYGEDLNAEQVEELREQVDLALQDPDYSIITNFQVTWEEMGADQRLPDWSWVFEMVDRRLYAGLGVTETLLSGESSYSGDRLHLEVINTRFMLFRETMKDLVEDYFFKPMCARMGFVEEDEDGNLQVIVPELSFTRLALRDNSETFDALFNLYQKGSLDIDIILDLLNIDPVATREKLERDMFTVNDATFNEVLRGLYSSVGQALAENSDVADKIAENLGLKYEKPKEEGGGRFASLKDPKLSVTREELRDLVAQLVTAELVDRADDPVIPTPR